MTIGFKHLWATDFTAAPQGLLGNFDQSCDIAKALIEPLSGKRVYAPRRVSDQRRSVSDKFGRKLKDQRIGPSFAVYLHVARKVGEAGIQLAFNVRDWLRGERFGGAAFHIPGQIGAIAKQGQGGEWSFWGKQLTRNPVMRARQFYIRRENRLFIVAPFRSNPRRLTNR